MKKAIVLSLIFLALPFLGRAQILITEVMYDAIGSDTGNEWVEFYNAGEPKGFTNDWRFNDGSSHTLTLTQGTTTIGSGDFFIVTDSPDNWRTIYPDYTGTIFDSVVNISNTSSTVALSLDKGETFVDLLHFNSDWGASGTGKTLEKINFNLGADRANWQESFIIGGTPGADSSQAATTTVGVIEEERDYTDMVMINEIFPNPLGSDTEGEWIELYSRYQQAVDLTGWELQDGSSRIYQINNTRIEPNTYVIFRREQTGISLNNTSEKLTLRDDAGKIIDDTNYGNVDEGSSWARFDDEWQVTRQTTPGSKNIIPQNYAPIISLVVSKENVAPNESIVFDASKSSDPEGSALDYKWDFGDGSSSARKTISHKFSEVGIFVAELIISDDQGLESSKSILITVSDNKETVSSKADKEEKVNADYQLVEGIIITEFLANPQGDDLNEWIELYNETAEPINISGWQLDDADGGSKPFIFPAGTIVNAQSFQVWSRKATKLALNNSSDEVRLLWPTGEIISQVAYSGVKEGQVYVWDWQELEWVWSENESAGKPNIIVKGVELTEQNESGVSETVVPSTSIVGLVVVPPQTWAKQKFYIVDPESPNSSLMEIYNYRGEFPELQRGDIVQIFDYELSELKTGSRYKIQAPEQIIKIDTIPLEWPDIYDVSEVTEEMVNQYIAIQGTIEKVNKNSIRIKDDLQSLLIYLGSGWQWQEFKPEAGLGILVRGVVQQSGSSLTLRPIAVTDFKLETIVINDDIKGAVSLQQNVQQLEVEPKNNKKTAFYIISPAALAGLGWAGYKFLVSKVL